VDQGRLQPDHPVAPGTFQSTHVQQGALFLDQDRVWYLYTASDGTRYTIGAVVQLLE